MHNICIIKMAPTIFRTRNLRIVIYPKDHKPAHVHVIGAGAEAKFDIETLECLDNFGFSDRSLRMIEKFLKDRKHRLKEI